MGLLQPKLKNLGIASAFYFSRVISSKPTSSLLMEGRRRMERRMGLGYFGRIAARVPRPRSLPGSPFLASLAPLGSKPRTLRDLRMERRMGFEPTTSTLARSHSTTELPPLANFYEICSPEAALLILSTYHYTERIVQGRGTTSNFQKSMNESMKTIKLSLGLSVFERVLSKK